MAVHFPAQRPLLSKMKSWTIGKQKATIVQPINTTTAHGQLLSRHHVRDKPLFRREIV